MGHGEPSPARPAVVLVPAPIKRAYIWDLAPRVSVVRRCVERGLAPYVVHWHDPDPAGPDLGLADYAGRLLGEAVDAAAGETGRRHVALVGHSLGGTLAAIHAALCPDRVSSAVLVEAPLRFGAEGSGAFAPLLALAPPLGPAAASSGSVPGTALDVVAVGAAWDEFVVGRWADWLASTGDPAALALHLRVERWALDELALPARLFADVVQALYRDDAFFRGMLVVDGRRLGPSSLGIPLLAVVDRSSRVVPPASVLPFREARPPAATSAFSSTGARRASAPSTSARSSGRGAHRHLWPRILAWVAERA